MMNWHLCGRQDDLQCFALFSKRLNLSLYFFCLFIFPFSLPHHLGCLDTATSFPNTMQVMSPSSEGGANTAERKTLDNKDLNQ